MGDGMRALKIATVVMAVMIVFGTAGLVIAMVMRRPAPPAIAPSLAVVLDQPDDTRIEGVAAVQDRLAILLRGGGADRVVLVDPRTGALSGQITLRK
jgi:hypothetical protein